MTETMEVSAPSLSVGSAVLPGEWSWSPLGEVTLGIYDCPHSTPKLTDDGPYVVRTQDIISGTFRKAGAARVSRETYLERIKRAVPTQGDLLYSREGTYFGIAAEVPEGEEVCLGQRMVLIRPDASVVNYRYLRYWLNSPFMASHVHGSKDGSVAARLNVSTIRKLPTLLPQLVEQAAIAETLGALDDKIAVNERIVAAAKELGAAKAAQVSASAMESAVLGDILELKYGKSLPAARRVAGEIPVFGSGGISGTHIEALLEGPGIIIGRKGTVGSVYWSEGGFFPIDTTFYVVCRGNRVSMEYAYFLLKGLGLEEMNSDSAVPGLNRDRALSVRIKVPDAHSIQRFTVEARELFAMLRVREQENQTLATLRDTLLPQLMSGRIRVKDAEEIVEDHV
ncbi:restriction endonuclease subunit S [Streptomyces mobaraensis]|uniref:Restriction endonuclease subunit S n=1 Tax=Streptomyces mobaraensis TaxID=35621 RepID=A0A5N5WEE9_STRMB|nr:restriction endonuclease subunit S [Streptomyces mobaraensis]KAB7852302.1 restriction endonuclease subunit S [Streptomyces mobaraensis]